jgi:adenylate cyclase
MMTGAAPLIGSARVTVLWGAPVDLPDQVYRACIGAMRAAHRVGRLNHEWAGAGLRQMRVRLGLHFADVVVGNVGSSERLSHIVIGDGVNVASRKSLGIVKDR